MSRAGVEVATREGLAVLLQSGRLGALTDGELLKRGDGADAALAFDVLVARHGGMVLRVCRSILNDGAAADDAFQATFLVLWKKAPGLWVRDSIGPWLHGVAVRVARKAKQGASRRAHHEAMAMQGRQPDPSVFRDETVALIHEEVGRLPDKYRMPVVLCHLEGLTHEDAARSLAWPVGTVRGRLSRARDLLRSRLIRRGIAPAVAAFGAGLKQAKAEHVPALLVDRTWKAVSVEGTKGAPGVVSEAVATLVRQELHAMIAAKVKIGAMVLLAGALTAGVGAMAQTAGKTTEILGKPRPTETAVPKPIADSVPPDERDDLAPVPLPPAPRGGKQAKSAPKSPPKDEQVALRVVVFTPEETKQFKELLTTIATSKVAEDTYELLDIEKKALIKLLQEANFGVPKSLRDDGKENENAEVCNNIKQRIAEINEELVEARVTLMMGKLAQKLLTKELHEKVGKDALDEILPTGSARNAENTGSAVSFTGPGTLHLQGGPPGAESSGDTITFMRPITVRRPGRQPAPHVGHPGDEQLQPSDAPTERLYSPQEVYSRPGRQPSPNSVSAPYTGDEPPPPTEISPNVSLPLAPRPPAGSIKPGMPPPPTNSTEDLTEYQEAHAPTPSAMVQQPLVPVQDDQPSLDGSLRTRPGRAAYDQERRLKEMERKIDLILQSLKQDKPKNSN